jgi:hypothetical protein
MSAFAIFGIVFGICAILFIFYVLSVFSRYDKLPVCGGCGHKLEREDIIAKDDKGNEVKRGSREFCPNCRASGRKMAGWYYGYVPKGGSFAE